MARSSASKTSNYGNMSGPGGVRMAKGVPHAPPGQVAYRPRLVADRWGSGEVERAALGALLDGGRAPEGEEFVSIDVDEGSSTQTEGRARTSEEPKNGSVER